LPAVHNGFRELILEMQMQSNNLQELVVVLGMHRSGTSVMARSLKVFDVELGDRLIPPNENVNAKGFWEDADINAFNIEMMAAIGIDWHELAPIEIQDILKLTSQGYFQRAQELLNEKVGTFPRFGLKEPRIAKMLPFWKRVFNSTAVEQKYILALRNPLSVASSLEKRDGFDLEKSCLLWLDHVVTSLKTTVGSRRVVVDYDRLMLNPEQEMERVGQHLELQLNKEELEVYKAAFLDKELQHTSFDNDHLQASVLVSPLIKEIYSVLLDAASGLRNVDSTDMVKLADIWSEDLEKMSMALRMSDRLSRKLNEAANEVVFKERANADLASSCAHKESRIHELELALKESGNLNAELSRRIEDFTQSLEETGATVTSLSRTIEEIHRSTSWRLTKPLRHAGTSIRRMRSLASRICSGVQRAGGISSFVVKGMKVFRKEGVAGVRARFSFIDNGVSQGAARRSEYSYFAPRKPSNFDRMFSSLKRRPLFSIVVPVYNTPEILLHKVVESVLAQWYPDWQLVLCDDASTSMETKNILATIKDPRITVLSLDKNSGIAEATNAALKQAEGEFVVFLDHDDELTCDCLWELALCVDREDPDFIYSDEDKISEDNRFITPHFKPAWSPDAMMSTMYVCHVTCIRRTILEKLGGLRQQYDGCQDWDLILRLAEITNRIAHVPKVLYHWRIIPASIAADISAKPYAIDASKRVREDALVRRGLDGLLEPLPGHYGYFRVKYQVKGHPLVSIVIPSRDNVDLLRRCIDSIWERTEYKNFELIIIDNGSIRPETLAYLHQLEASGKGKVIRHDKPFNFSELNNIGAAQAKGELLLFLNDDTEVLQSDWLNRMAGFAQLSHVGAVGAKLLYPGGKQVQHAGVLNLEDGPGHAFLEQDIEYPGYFLRNQLEYNWLAVTGACLMVAREKFEAVGGFDETLPVAYNDVELCVRLVNRGFYNVVCQAVKLIHHESVSRGVDHLSDEKKKRLKRDKRHFYSLHPHFFQYDPFYSPNLHPNGCNFELAL
jgi:GT2 family glycosyltransferase